MFTEEHRIIIKYLRIKYGDGAKKIVKDHPEFDWKVDGVRHLIEKIDATGSIARKEGSGRPRNVRTEENIQAVEGLILRLLLVVCLLSCFYLYYFSLSFKIKLFISISNKKVEKSNF